MVLYDFDAAKSERNLRERGFDFDFAALVFEGEVIEFVDNREDYGETRIIASGHVDGLMYAVVYTLRGDVRWIISAFRSRRRELARWKTRAAGR